MQTNFMDRPDDLSAAETERWAIERLVTVATLLFAEFPPDSLLPRLLQPLLVELGEWACDERYDSPLGGERVG